MEATNDYNAFWKLTEDYHVKLGERREKLAKDAEQIRELIEKAKKKEATLMYEFKMDMRQLTAEFKTKVAESPLEKVDE